MQFKTKDCKENSDKLKGLAVRIENFAKEVGENCQLTLGTGPAGLLVLVLVLGPKTKAAFPPNLMLSEVREGCVQEFGNPVFVKYEIHPTKVGELLWDHLLMERLSAALRGGDQTYSVQLLNAADGTVSAIYSFSERFGGDVILFLDKWMTHYQE